MNLDQIMFSTSLFTIATTTVAKVAIFRAVASAAAHVTHVIFRHFDSWWFSVEVVKSFDLY